MLQTTRIVREDIRSPRAVEAIGKTNIAACQEYFWHYRIAMNPRLNLKGRWFPHTLA
jgi:hypothetical protein